MKDMQNKTDKIVKIVRVGLQRVIITVPLKKNKLPKFGDCKSGS